MIENTEPLPRLNPGLVLTETDSGRSITLPDPQTLPLRTVYEIHVPAGDFAGSPPSRHLYFEVRLRVGFIDRPEHYWAELHFDYGQIQLFDSLDRRERSRN